MDLIGEERGRLARAAGWLDASRAEAAGLVVLLVGALVVTGALVWGALGRPSLAADATGTPGLATGTEVADVGADPRDGADVTGSDAHPPPPDQGVAGPHDHHDGSAPSTGEVTVQQAGEVTVHVAGAVGRPGVVTLPGGSRVADAIEQAGGLGPDADTARINLARPLTDGEQVVVLREGEEAPRPLPGEPSGGASPSGDGPHGADATAPDGAAGGRVDVNTAGLAELETLPGIGPALAQRIVTHREQHGPFRQPGDLRDVSGIGEKRFQDLADRVTVG